MTMYTYIEPLESETQKRALIRDLEKHQETIHRSMTTKHQSENVDKAEDINDITQRMHRRIYEAIEAIYERRFHELSLGVYRCNPYMSYNPYAYSAYPTYGVSYPLPDVPNAQDKRIIALHFGDLDDVMQKQAGFVSRLAMLNSELAIMQSKLDLCQGQAIDKLQEQKNIMARVVTYYEDRHAGLIAEFQDFSESALTFLQPINRDVMMVADIPGLCRALCDVRDELAEMQRNMTRRLNFPRNALADEQAAGNEDIIHYNQTIANNIQQICEELIRGLAQDLTEMAEITERYFVGLQNMDDEHSVRVLEYNQKLGVGLGQATITVLPQDAYVHIPAEGNYLKRSLDFALKGDMSNEFTLLGMAANIGIGLIPVVGQMADARDLNYNAQMADTRGAKENIGAISLSVIAFIPGVGDAVKSLKYLKRLKIVRKLKLFKKADVVVEGAGKHLDDIAGGAGGISSKQYTEKIKWGIHDNIDARPYGKGFFGKRIEQKNPRVDAYELKINPNNESFYLEHPNGGFVQFENAVGEVAQDGKLIMQSRSFYHVDDMPDFAKNKVLQEATRQLEAANKAGYKVEWLVSEEKALEQLERFFKSNNIDITVKYFPE